MSTIWPPPSPGPFGPPPQPPPVNNGAMLLVTDQTAAGKKTFTDGVAAQYLGVGGVAGTPGQPLWINALIDGSAIDQSKLVGGQDLVGQTLGIVFQGGFAGLVHNIGASIASGDNHVTLTSGTFPTYATSWKIKIPGAGAAGATLTANISAVTDSTHATIDVLASTTVAGSAGTISPLADPSFLFGADDFIIVKNNGDLVGITDFFARISELHIRDATTSLGHATGLQGQVAIEAAATVGSAYGIKGISSAVAGVTINDLFSVYAQNPVTAGSGVTRARALYADGPAQFNGLRFNTSGANAPDAGVYLGIGANTNVGVELAAGPTKTTFVMSNDGNNHWHLENAGISVLMTVNTSGDLTTGGALAVTSNVGFYGHAPTAKQTVTGSKSANAALASLITALAAIGLVTDSST